MSDRVLVLVHADCGHILMTAADGNSKPERAGSEALRDSLHAIGMTRVRLRRVDGIVAKKAAVEAMFAEDECTACVVPDGEREHPTVKAILTARGTGSARPVLNDQGELTA